jgi:phenylpyruvate tautomerase PptA (4-oxalocrotonate tautomerase family)
MTNSVGMKTKTSTNKTIKSLNKQARKKVLIKLNKMMTLLPLQEMQLADVRVKIHKVEGKISMMMRYNQDQLKKEVALEVTEVSEEVEVSEEATVVLIEEDSILTLEIIEKTMKGRHQ